MRFDFAITRRSLKIGIHGASAMMSVKMPFHSAVRSAFFAGSDMLSAATLSHGDTKHPMLIPSSVSECYSMAMEAFDLAERLQTPVFVMSDLDLGMNTWMSYPFDYPTKPLDRGKRVRHRFVLESGGRVAPGQDPFLARQTRARYGSHRLLRRQRACQQQHRQ